MKHVLCAKKELFFFCSPVCVCVCVCTCLCVFTHSMCVCPHSIIKNMIKDDQEENISDLFHS